MQRGSEIRQKEVEDGSYRCEEEAVHTQVGGQKEGRRAGDGKEESGTDETDVHPEMSPNRSTQLIPRGLLPKGRVP